MVHVHKCESDSNDYMMKLDNILRKLPVRKISGVHYG